MKKLFYGLLAIIFICFSGSMHAMKRKNILKICNPRYANQIQEPLWLPEEIITLMAGYCAPKEKNILMRLSQAFYAALKNRTAILTANPFTVSLPDKIEDTIKYARSGNTGMIELLLKHGIKADCKNILGVSPLHVAQAKVMQLLIDGGANVNEIKPESHPLHEAVNAGDKEAVQILLDSKTNPELDLKNILPPLFIATTKGHTDIVKLLLAAGAKVNRLNGKNESVLMIASKYGYKDIVALLIGAGANVNHTIPKSANVNDRTVGGISALSIAIEGRHTEIVRLLLAAGASTIQLNCEGKRPLHIASKDGLTDIAKLLIDVGADVNHVIASNGVSALLIASGHDMEKFLLAAKANANLVDNCGMSALLIASQQGHTDIVKLLLAAKANVNHVAKGAASCNDYTDALRLMLTHINPGHVANSALSKNGSSALLIASQQGHTDIVKLLIEAKANVNHVGNNGMSALLFASRNGHTDIVKLLIEAGASVSHTDNYGWSALVFASKNGYIHIVELLQNQLQNGEMKKNSF